MTLPQQYAEQHLDHAYALIVHAAQGATVTEAYVLASDASRLAEWGYVALSRAREATHIYVLDTMDAREVGAVEPAPAKPTIDDRALGMSRPAAEPLALDQVAPSPERLRNSRSTSDARRGGIGVNSIGFSRASGF